MMGDLDRCLAAGAIYYISKPTKEKYIVRTIRQLLPLHKCCDGETSLYHNEHRLLCKEGRYNWILARGKIIERTPEGKPL